MTTGEKIKYYRKKNQLTQKELGLRSGFTKCPDVRIRQYESDNRTPKTEMLQSIAKSLNIKTELLIERNIQSEADVLAVLEEIKDIYGLQILTNFVLKELEKNKQVIEILEDKIRMKQRMD